MRASEWRELKRFYTSPGFAEEEVTVFFATGLERGERRDRTRARGIEIVAWPLAELDAADRRVRGRQVAGRAAALAPRRSAAAGGRRLRRKGRAGGGENQPLMADRRHPAARRASRSGARFEASRARLPRLPGAGARAVPQHPQRLPHRPAPVRRVPRGARA